MSTNKKTVIATVVWLALCLSGLAYLLTWEHIPGSKGAAPERMAELFGPVAPKEYLLVMSVHPQCPCSSASLSELALLITHCPNVRAKVLFYSPTKFSDHWAKSALWTSAAAIPRVEPIIDKDGVLSRQMGASTSGHSVLSDAQGKVLFVGGITDSRGHEGENDGRSNVENIAAGKKTERVLAQTNVFGCPLDDPIAKSSRLK